MYQKPCRLTIADKYFGGGAPSIPQQNFGSELSQVLQAYPKFVQKGYGLVRDYAPKFAQQDVDLSKQYAPQYAGLGLDISKQFAPGYLDLNLAQMQKNIAGQPLLQGLNTQAQQQLALQGQLTPQEAYQETQGTLGTFGGRNNVFNQAAAAD